LSVANGIHYCMLPSSRGHMLSCFVSHAEWDAIIDMSPKNP
jgi:hypothetical protein